jgi:hypothetical protein
MSSQPGRVELDPRLHPAPAFPANRSGDAFELLTGQPGQHVRVGQEAPLLVVEQVAPHDAARRLVGLDADEADQRVAGSFDLTGRQLALERGRCASGCMTLAWLTGIDMAMVDHVQTQGRANSGIRKRLR